MNKSQKIIAFSLVLVTSYISGCIESNDPEDNDAFIWTADELLTDLAFGNSSVAFTILEPGDIVKIKDTIDIIQSGYNAIFNSTTTSISFLTTSGKNYSQYVPPYFFTCEGD